MMPVLVTTKRKSRPCRVEMAVHSSSVAGRPMLVNRFESLMPSSICSRRSAGFLTSALAREPLLVRSTSPEVTIGRNL
jgi:hypothetical protein